MNGTGAGTEVQLQGIYGDFAGYASVEEEHIAKALDTGLVVLDTNAVLHLYSFHGQAREDFLEILTKIGDRLFVPHQVMEEFWRNRRQALIDNSRRFKEREEITAHWEDVHRKYQRWHRRAVSRTEVKSETFLAVEQSMDKLLSEMAHHEQEMAAIGPDTPTFEDEVLKKLAEILEGKVGKRPAPGKLRDMLEEGIRRVKDQIPPGYKDNAKADHRSAGDYLVWEQALLEAERRGDTDLVFITQDNKEDWWLYPGTEEQRARPELVAEYKARTGRDLYLLRTVALLEYGSGLGIEVSTDTLDQVRTVEDEQLMQAEWDLPLMTAYLRELGMYNEARLNILEKAVEGNGHSRGRILRGQIAAIMRVRSDSSLRGITSPFKTVMNKMVERGVLPEGLTVPFEAGPGKIDKCWVPKDLIDVVSDALSALRAKVPADQGTPDVVPLDPAEQEQTLELADGDGNHLFSLQTQDGVRAEGILLEHSRFRVLNGQFRAEPRNSAQKSHIQIRQRMENDGFLEDGSDQTLRRLTKHYDFESPSQASSCVLFTNTSGNEKWKDVTGRTLGEILRSGQRDD